MAEAAEYEKALKALGDELADISRWNSAPQTAYMREMGQKGQLHRDQQRLDKKLNEFRSAMPTRHRAKFDACVLQVTMAFGTMVIHADQSYDDQLNIMRGWSEAWGKLHTALDGLDLFLSMLSAEGTRPGRSRGSGGPRVDLFGTDRGCA